MQDPAAFRYSCDVLVDRYKDKGIDKIVGIDARGFVFGAVVAYQLGIGFVPVRKKGKLPDLKGRDKIPGCPVFAMVEFEGE